MTQVVFVRVHETDAAREILASAENLADDHEVGTPEWIAVFNKAVDLLAARLPLQPQPMPNGLPFDLNALRG